MADEHRRLLDLDRTIHEPARLTIVAILSVLEQADFLYLLRETGLTKGNLNSHLTRLEQAGYVAVEKTYRGKIPQTLYSLTKAGRAVFEDYCTRLRQAIDPGA